MTSRRDRLRSQISNFIRQYGRKRHPDHDPNDRGYDRRLERGIKRMDPRELDELLRDEVEEP